MAMMTFIGCCDHDSHNYVGSSRAPVPLWMFQHSPHGHPNYPTTCRRHVLYLLEFLEHPRQPSRPCWVQLQSLRTSILTVLVGVIPGALIRHQEGLFRYMQEERKDRDQGSEFGVFRRTQTCVAASSCMCAVDTSMHVANRVPRLNRAFGGHDL